MHRVTAQMFFVQFESAQLLLMNSYDCLHLVFSTAMFGESNASIVLPEIDFPSVYGWYIHFWHY